MDKTDNTREELEKKYASFLPFVPETVVVGNGEFPVHPLPLSVLDKATFVVCCDGGTNALVASGRVPDLIVGDGDSLSEENRSRFQSLLYVNPDQETNDQTKAVSWPHGAYGAWLFWRLPESVRIIRWATSVCCWNINGWDWK